MLTSRLADVERLVLLGDVLELRQGTVAEGLARAVPVLEDLGRSLGPGREVLLTAGNHDHRLLRPWLDRRSTDPAISALGLQSPVSWEPQEPLEVMARALAPAELRVAYPGLWLREDVYATHGHYLDPHMSVPVMERMGAAVMGRMLGRPPDSLHSAEDYEVLLTPMYDWLDAVAQAGGDTGGGFQVRVWRTLQPVDGRRGWRQRGASLALPLAVAALNRAGLGPVGADVSGPELRRSGLQAFGEVLKQLGVTAGHVVFGHTHRAGPLPDDDRSEWATGGGTALHNLGCWVYTSGFGGRISSRDPYRPGFALLLEDEGPPELINLLD